MKFEDVLADLDIKEFSKMSSEELGDIVQNLRKLRTAVPETKQRRRKKRSKAHLASLLLSTAKDMMEKEPEKYKDMTIPEVVAQLMQKPDFADLLGGDDEPDDE